MIWDLVIFLVGMCAGGAVIYLFKDKGAAVVADVKKDISA